MNERNEPPAQRLKRSMRRPGGRHVVLVLCASLLVGSAAIWHWMNRPALRLRCPGGARPAAVVVGSTIGVGHGGMAASVRLDGDTVTSRFLSDLRERRLSDAEQDLFFRRLEHPAELDDSYIPAEAWLTVAWDCPGGFHEEELEGKVSRAHFTLDWLIHDPEAAVRSLDPRPRRVLAAAYEVTVIAHSFSKE